MKTTVDSGMFVDTFRAYDRFDQFGGPALRALFDYLEGLEDDTGEEIELDVIALCCDWTVYKNLEAFREEYDEKYETIEDVEHDTTVIRVDWKDADTDGVIIVQAF